MDYSKKQTALRISALLIIAPLCYAGLSQYLDLLDGDLIISKLDTIGLPVIIILVPYLFVILSDTIGWKYSFGNLKSKLTSAKLFLLRVATESLQTSLPGGAVYAEIVRPVLIKKYFRFEYAVSISANIITKVNILIAQLLFLVLGFCIFILSFNDGPSFLLFPDYIFYSAIGILFIVSAFTVYLLYSRNLLISLLGIFERLKFKSVKNICDKIRNNVYEINQILHSFSKRHKKDLGVTILFFLLTWFLMSFESFIILKIIGVDVNIMQMIAVESLISIIRMIFFFIPGAVGAQDIGIVILFNLSGINDPQTNAVLFILFKRIKEFFWIITGYTILILLGISPRKIIKNKKFDLRPASENL